MPINWNTVEAKERLFLATVAACDPKLDYRRIATFYGQGATYDSIEGQFRKIRNGAKELKAKVESGEISEAPPRGVKPGSTPRRSPAKPKEKTIGGRVSKANNGTPTKQSKSTKKIKEEFDGGFGGLQDEQGMDAEDAVDFRTDFQSDADHGEFDFFDSQGSVNHWV